MNLTGWARAQGIAPRTACRWFREGTLPVPAERVGPRTILVNIDAYGLGSASNRARRALEAAAADE
ncbi:putative site-specific integrase-resolvase [Actinopolymorpha pittospori]|uniref:Site-specific integrase-resolvase n=1 Tax=Actinopolymorpha pittospori TaxID=648752 RepID=A0A927N0X4_9ACTN|nr:putative site-specific integrase-resolvase [Actinopolymorpha pittospori]